MGWTEIAAVVAATPMLLGLGIVVGFSPTLYGVSLRVLTRPQMEPPVRLAWILVVEALPLIGIAGYLLFGEIRMNGRDRQRREDIRERLIPGLREEALHGRHLEEV